METILSRLSLLSLRAPEIRRIARFLFIGLVLAGIVMALIPAKGIEINHFDKLLHTSALFGFAFLLDIATPRSFWRWKVPLLLGYGALIEVLQAFTPWRAFSVADFAADVLGVCLYWLLWYTVLKPYIAHPQG